MCKQPCAKAPSYYWHSSSHMRMSRSVIILHSILIADLLLGNRLRLTWRSFYLCVVFLRCSGWCVRVWMCTLWLHWAQFQFEPLALPLLFRKTWHVSGGVSCTVPVLAPGRAERDTYVLQLHLEPSGVAEPSCNRAIGQLGWKGP